MGLSLLHSPRYHLCGPALKWMHTGFHEIEAFLTEGVRMPIELGYTGTRVWKGAFHSESIGFLPEYLISNNSHQQWESFSFWTCFPQKKKKKCMFFSWTSFWRYFLQMNALTLLCREHSELSRSELPTMGNLKSQLLFQFWEKEEDRPVIWEEKPQCTNISKNKSTT